LRSRATTPRASARKSSRTPSSRPYIQLIHRIVAREVAVVNIILSIPVEHSNIYASILIARPESQSCGRMKEVRIEYYRAILPIRDAYSSRLLSL